MQITFINAAESHFKARMDRSALKVNLLSSNPVGVGEHGDVFDDFIDAVKEFTDAQDGFNTIQNFKQQIVASQTNELSNTEVPVEE
tara:strand:+ start:871 stop:1128 length:258 start_codon:yes stop_codon:yes gene_type:complete